MNYLCYFSKAQLIYYFQIEVLGLRLPFPEIQFLLVGFSIIISQFFQLRILNHWICTLSEFNVLLFHTLNAKWIFVFTPVHFFVEGYIPIFEVVGVLLRSLGQSTVLPFHFRNFLSQLVQFKFELLVLLQQLFIRPRRLGIQFLPQSGGTLGNHLSNSACWGRTH